VDCGFTQEQDAKDRVACKLSDEYFELVLDDEDGLRTTKLTKSLWDRGYRTWRVNMNPDGSLEPSTNWSSNPHSQEEICCLEDRAWNHRDVFNFDIIALTAEGAVKIANEYRIQALAQPWLDPQGKAICYKEWPTKTQE
jgi:hypothetical protein